MDEVGHQKKRNDFKKKKTLYSGIWKKELLDYS